MIRTVCTTFREATIATTKSNRSKLGKDEARQRYIAIGELVVLKQVQTDAEALDTNPIAIGPFTTLDAAAVAAHDGKTRGAITNLFGSQAAFQAETMGLALSAGNWIAGIEYPDPAAFASADEWVDAFFESQSARGPAHRGKPQVNYGYLWALWLSAVPYGIWSEKISGPSMDEYAQWLKQLEAVFARALDHFGLALRRGTSLGDLASAAASLTEGAWLNQCLTSRHPGDPSEPIATALRRSGRMLWRGAVEVDKAR